jgi:hypothetical protein
MKLWIPLSNRFRTTLEDLKQGYIAAARTAYRTRHFKNGVSTFTCSYGKEFRVHLQTVVEKNRHTGEWETVYYLQRQIRHYFDPSMSYRERLWFTYESEYHDIVGVRAPHQARLMQLLMRFSRHPNPIHMRPYH